MKSDKAEQIPLNSKLSGETERFMLKVAELAGKVKGMTMSVYIGCLISEASRMALGVNDDDARQALHELVDLHVDVHEAHLIAEEQSK